MQTKAAITVSNIIGAAECLFLARSYAEVTMDQIAAACDVTKGALYHHFSSKEELYLAMMHADLDQKREILGRAVGSASGCRERLRRLTKAFFDLPLAKRGLIRLVRRDTNSFEETERNELIRAYQATLPELAERVISEGVACGELAPGDPRLLSWHFVAMVEVILSDYASRVFDTADDVIEHVLNLFFHGAAKGQQNGETQ